MQRGKMKTWVFSRSHLDFLGSYWVSPWGGLAAVINSHMGRGVSPHGAGLHSLFLSEG